MRKIILAAAIATSALGLAACSESTETETEEAVDAMAADAEAAGDRGVQRQQGELHLPRSVEVALLEAFLNLGAVVGDDVGHGKGAADASENEGGQKVAPDPAKTEKSEGALASTSEICTMLPPLSLMPVMFG